MQLPTNMCALPLFALPLVGGWVMLEVLFSFGNSFNWENKHSSCPNSYWLWQNIITGAQRMATAHQVHVSQRETGVRQLSWANCPKCRSFSRIVKGKPVVSTCTRFDQISFKGWVNVQLCSKISLAWTLYSFLFPTKYVWLCSVVAVGKCFKDGIEKNYAAKSRKGGHWRNAKVVLVQGSVKSPVLHRTFRDRKARTKVMEIYFPSNFHCRRRPIRSTLCKFLQQSSRDEEHLHVLLQIQSKCPTQYIVDVHSWWVNIHPVHVQWGKK